MSIIIFIIIWLACGIIAAYIFNQLLKSDFLEYEILDALCFLFGPATLSAVIVIFFNHWREKKKKYINLNGRMYDKKMLEKAVKQWEESGYLNDIEWKHLESELVKKVKLDEFGSHTISVLKNKNNK